MTRGDKPGIGILGGGMMSQVGHLPFYLRDSRCEVLAVAEQRPSLIAALSDELGADRVVPDHRDVLARSDVSAVVISAPRPATGPMTLAALEAGKHVLAEKPMAHTSDQAQRLVNAAAERDLIYAVGFMKRYDPGVAAAKALFDEVTADGRLGKLLLARFYDFSSSYAAPVPPHTRPSESRSERFDVWPLCPDWLAGQFRDIYPWFINAATHDVNLLRHFFPGDLEIAAARCLSEGGVTATFSHAGVPVVLEIARTGAGRWLEGMEFLFERGRIGARIPSPMATDAVTEVMLDDPERGLHAAPVETGEGWCFARQASGFVDALTGAAPPLTTGADGLGDMILSEEIFRKAAE